MTLAGLLWMSLGTGVLGLMRLLVLLVLARMLTPRDFGVVTAALVVVGFSTIFCYLGVGPAVVQRKDLGPSHVRTGFTLSALFGLAMTVLIWLFAPQIAAFFHIGELQGVVRVMSVSFLFLGVSVVAESLLQRELRFRHLAMVDVVAFGLGFGAVGITLAVRGMGVWALVAGYVSQTILKAVLMLAIQPHAKRPMLDRAAARDLIYFGGGFTIARIGNYLGAQGANLVVGRWLGAGPLGIYGRAHELMVTPAMAFGQILDRVLFPAMAKVQGHSQRLTAAYRRGIALTALVMLPASGAFYVLAPELIDLVLGPKWTAAIRPFQILALGMMFRTSYKISDSIARATGAVYRRAWRQWVYAVLVTAGAWFGSFWGVEGTAVFVLGAITVNFILMAQLSLRLTGMTWTSFWVAQLPALVLTVVFSGEVWVLSTLIRPWNLPPACLLSTAAAVVLLSAFVLFRYVPRLVLGHDGVWMLSTVASYLPFLQRFLRGRTPRVT